MKIPLSGRKKALLLVDIQEIFLKPRNRYILANIQRLLKSVPYDLYFEALFWAPNNSIWSKQLNWTSPKRDSKPEQMISKLLKTKKTVYFQKNTKSAFKGNFSILKTLNKNKIKEVHIVGLDTNDCVLATAYEAFDFGFYTYVIEECVESSGGLSIHKHGLATLRHVNLTNKSLAKKQNFLSV